MAETTAHPNNVLVKFKGKPVKEFTDYPAVKRAHKAGKVSAKQIRKKGARGR